MPDTDSNGAAWRVAPSAYLATRPAEFALPPRPQRSCYIAMPDGVRIAADVWLPERATGALPTILIHTPYYRRFALAPGAMAEACPNAAKFRDAFVPRGYALVVADARGTGASFGTRDSFRSPRERADSATIADWIVAQPWSDGRIGATGISYPGAASDFLASTGHPAVRAIAPLFAVWDTWSDHYWPGGILLGALAQSYDDLMVAMDQDRRDMLRRVSYFADPALQGPAPVDEDADGALLRAALDEHAGNVRQPAFVGGFPYRDEALPYDPSFTMARISPYHYRRGIRPDVAIYCVSGWMDGAGYANGAIARYLTMAENPRHLLLGPWDHGARINTSPWRAAEAPEFPLLAELTRFFDEYLMGRDTGLRAEAPVHVFHQHAEVWQAAAQWPPHDESAALPLGAAGGFDGAPGQVAHRTDPRWGSGSGTRYERIAAIDARAYHTDWQAREARLTSWTGAPLAISMELSGHAVAELTIASSEPDASVLLYLSEVAEDGTVRYVTEGLLRLIHRAEAPHPEDYVCTWPWRSFARGAARPMVPGNAERVRIPLLPTGWTFARGSRLRLSLSGTDADHIGQHPHGRPPVISVTTGDGASLLHLPWRAVP
ncbi:CocE/NonD family hydrolase [Roseomonas rosulenta]|uniref:CocE/NonD family hydrolase n=1 Tax=Roseomonas rosulenta TaxID=2748667 RepID=UPI0018DFC16E|nr:CocE/NonD family hydrolase [Roseomonas rosulenta]